MKCLKNIKKKNEMLSAVNRILNRKLNWNRTRVNVEVYCYLIIYIKSNDFK